ncbi:hypothetical protein UACE39S_02363 [Ureibacillus acetophenoni]
MHLDEKMNEHMNIDPCVLFFVTIDTKILKIF